MRLLPHGTYVEAVGSVDVNVLVGALGNARPYYRKIFFLVSGCARVNERRGAGTKLLVAHQALLHLCRADETRHGY